MPRTHQAACRQALQRELVFLVQAAARQTTGAHLENELAWQIVRTANGRRGPVPLRSVAIEAVHNTRGARRGERGPLTRTRIRREVRFR